MSNTMLVLVLIGLLFIIIAAVAIVIVLAFKTKRKKKPSQVAKENDELKKNSKKGNVKLQEMDVINYMDDSLKSTRRFCSPDGVNPRPLEYLEINDGGRPIYVCTMFTHSLPHTSTFATTYAPLMNMPDCITNVYIEPLTQAKSEKMADKQVIALDSEARAASKNYDVNRSRKMSTRVAKVEEWARVIESGLNNFYRVAFSFTLRATTVKGLYDAAAKLYSVAIEKNIELSAAYATHLEAYMSAAPLNAILKIGFGPLKDKIVSYDILDKNSLGDIFNHTEAFFSHKNGILWGRNSLTGQPVLIDPYDKSHSNYNFCISGISGVGKSASVKMMMSRLIEMEGYYEALQSVYHTKDSDPQHIDIIFKPVSYEACGPYYLFYCTIEYSYLSKEGISKSSGKLEYCFTMRKLGTIDNNGNNLGEQWRFLDFNIQDIGALYTRFTPVSDEKTGNQLSPGLYEATTKANKED